MDNTVPVVVLRSVHHGGLGIVRSLGRLGVPVYVADADPWTPAFASRYCRGRFLLDVENGRGGRALEGLLKIGRKIGGRPLLIPTSDRATVWVADHAEALHEQYRFPRQPASLVRALCDKSRMQLLAGQCGVPTAKSFCARSREDLVRFLESAEFPLMVKPIDDGLLRQRAGKTKFVIKSPRELLDLYDRVEDPRSPNLLLQEYIPGEDWMFNGYFDRDSECLAGITGRKIRRFPVHTGVTSLGECIRNECVGQTTKQFMKAIGYQGILDIGYRYDRRDGQYKVLDVNPRIGCTFRLFVSENGMDVARALYLDLTGQAVAAAPASEGRKWIVEDFDMLSALGCWRDGSQTCKEWLRSFRGIRETACFAADDPLPVLPMCVSNCCELYRWLHRRLGSRTGGAAGEGDVSPPAAGLGLQGASGPRPG